MDEEGAQGGVLWGGERGSRTLRERGRGAGCARPHRQPLKPQPSSIKPRSDPSDRPITLNDAQVQAPLEKPAPLEAPPPLPLVDRQPRTR